MLAELLQIDRIDNLYMLDPPALIALISFGKLLDRADDLRIGRIANGVDSGLEAVHRRAHHQIADFSAGEELQASLARGVGIWLFEPSASAAQCAI